MFLHYKHTVAAIVLWFRESFFFFLRLFNPFVYSTGIVATVPLGTVATVQNFKKKKRKKEEDKVANQNGTVDEQ